MTPLVAFYRGLGPDARGRDLDRVLAASDAEFEAVHDFIQWIFPLPEASGYNPDAPLLTAADAAEFRADPAMRANLARALDRFLRFLGLAIDGDRVVDGPGLAREDSVFRRPNHNWLRITRVIGCLRLLGFEDRARAFSAALERIAADPSSAIDPVTLGYWRRAATREPL